MVDPKQLVPAAEKQMNTTKWNGHRITPLTGTNSVGSTLLLLLENHPHVSSSEAPAPVGMTGRFCFIVKRVGQSCPQRSGPERRSMPS